MTSSFSNIAPLSEELHAKLRLAVRGPVHLRGSSEFFERTSIFHAFVTPAKVVVCPLDAEDVSKVMEFCSQNSLRLSVKAGGYGTAGWAVLGDLVIDLCKLVEIDIEAPLPDGGFTSLRHQTARTKSTNHSLSRKRRRDEDASSALHGPGSQTVPDFLGEPYQLQPDSEDRPQTTRRRVEQLEQAPSTPSPTTSAPSRPFRSTTGSPSPAPPPIRPAGGGDPFGYLDAPRSASPEPPSVVQSVHPSSNPADDTWAAPVFTNSSLPPIPPNLTAHATPTYPHAYVTFSAGMRQKDIDFFTANHPLKARSLVGPLVHASIPYHVPFSAHPVGSGVMLLGGFGFLSRLYGLGIDNLVEVEMVLADGRIVIVNENEHPDLWWALRGAGPAFGVVTRYKAKAFPVRIVFAGNLIYRFNRATAPSLIKHFRDCVKGAPRELYANLLLTAGPAGKDSLIVIQLCYIGPKEKGQEYLLALSSWNGERCLLNEVSEKSFLHQQDSVAQVLRGKPGRQWFIRSALITSLPDELIHETVMAFVDTPVGCTWFFELAGGAVADFETCVPKTQREAAFTVTAFHQWELSDHDERCIQAAETWITKTLKSVQTGGPLPSFLGRDESRERIISCYGKNWTRLCEVKERYDPENVFRNTLWPVEDQKP